MVNISDTGVTRMVNRTARSISLMGVTDALTRPWSAAHAS